MMYYYLTLSDGTEVVYSDITVENNIHCVDVYFERPIEGGFDFARCRLPEYNWTEREGFTDNELEDFITFLRINEHLIYKHASAKGAKV